MPPDLAAALRSDAPPPHHARAKHLKLGADNVVHLRSAVRKAGRLRSRELLRQAFADTRALTVDLADALDVDERNAARALTGEKPLDIGDVLCLASTGPGGSRAARRLLALLRDELDRLESAASHD